MPEFLDLRASWPGPAALPSLQHPCDVLGAISADFSLLTGTFRAGGKAKARYNQTLRQETSFNYLCFTVEISRNFRTKPLTTARENHKLA